MAEQVKIMLDRLREEQLFAELGSDIANQIEIVTVRCTVDRHEQAEKVASQWQADLVLWGQAFEARSPDQPLSFSVTPRATLQPGSVLSIMDAGAYFVPFSTSFSFPQRAVVVVEDKRGEAGEAGGGVRGRGAPGPGELSGVSTGERRSYAHARTKTFMG